MQILWKLLSALVLTAVPLSAQTLEPKYLSDWEPHVQSHIGGRDEI